VQSAGSKTAHIAPTGAPLGKLLCSTIAENADMMRDLLHVEPLVRPRPVCSQCTLLPPAPDPATRWQWRGAQSLALPLGACCPSHPPHPFPPPTQTHPGPCRFSSPLSPIWCIRYRARGVKGGGRPSGSPSWGHEAAVTVPSRSRALVTLQFSSLTRACSTLCMHQSDLPLPFAGLVCRAVQHVRKLPLPPPQHPEPRDPRVKLRREAHRCAAALLPGTGSTNKRALPLPLIQSFLLLLLYESGTVCIVRELAGS
jgi:hypothetical protein